MTPLATLRLATESDVAALERVIPLSARTLQAATYTPAQIEGALGTVFAVDRRLIADGTYFVTERDGAIVGGGGWSRRKTLFGGDRGNVPRDDALLDPRCEAARIRAFFVRAENREEQRCLTRSLLASSAAENSCAG